MYCRKCGLRLIDTAKFCPSCGTPVLSKDQSETENSVEPVRKEEELPDTQKSKIREELPEEPFIPSGEQTSLNSAIPEKQELYPDKLLSDKSASSVVLEGFLLAVDPEEEKQTEESQSQYEGDGQSGRNGFRRKPARLRTGIFRGIGIGLIVLMLGLGAYFTFQYTGAKSSDDSAVIEKLTEIALHQKPLGVNGTKYGYNVENYQNTEASTWVYNEGISYFSSFEGSTAFINWISNEETKDILEISLDDLINVHLNYWDDCLYFLGADGIERIRTDGSNRTVVVDLSDRGDQTGFDNLMIYNGIMYLIEKETHDSSLTSKVLRYDLNGELIDTPISCTSNSALMVYDDIIYLFEKDSSGFLNGTIYTCPVDGTKSEKRHIDLSGHVRYMIPYKNDFYYVNEDYSEKTGYSMVSFQKYNPVTQKTDTVFTPKEGLIIRINHWCIILDNVYFCAVDSGEKQSSFRQIYYQVYRLSLNTGSLGNVTLNQDNVEVKTDYQYMVSSCFTAGENIYMMSNAEAFPDGKVEAYTQPLLWLDLQELPFSGNELNAVKVAEGEE